MDTGHANKKDLQSRGKLKRESSQPGAAIVEQDESIAVGTEAVKIPSNKRQIMDSSNTTIRCLSAGFVSGPHQRRYYGGIEMDYNPSNCHEPLHMRLAASWTLRVGDIIAVACDESETKNMCSAKPVKTSWFPFTKPWNPVQILAIYQEAASGTEEMIMELRWLYRPADLMTRKMIDLTFSKKEEAELFRAKTADRMVVEVDEFVSRCSVRNALGRIQMTSDARPHHRWLQKNIDQDGVPQISMICRYLYFSETMATQLHPVSDWSHYGSKLVGPLSRGLMCPKASSYKDLKLRQNYIEEIKSRFGLVDDELDQGLSSESSPVPLIPVTWSDELLNAAGVSLSKNCQLLHEERATDETIRKFLTSIEIPVISRRCDRRATANKTTANLATWSVEIGQLVCVALNSAKPPFSSNSNPWYPFIAPWTVGQVTSIYQDAKNDSSSGCPPKVEIRWFRRREDFSKVTQRYMPPKGSCVKGEEEFFESDECTLDIPACHILGTVNLFIGHHLEPSTVKLTDEIPCVNARCSYLYLASQGRFQPIFFVSSDLKAWFHGIRERALKLSPLTRSYPQLAESLQFYLPNTNLGYNALAVNFFSSLLADSSTSCQVPEPFYTKQSEKNERATSYFLKLSRMPDWDAFADTDFLFRPCDRANVSWTARIGDVIAIKADKSSKSAPFRVHPFAVSWEAAQIISISCSDLRGQAKHDIEDIDVEVRLLHYQTIGSETSPEQGVRLIYEIVGRDCTKLVKACDLICPLAMFPASTSGTISKQSLVQLWESVPRSLPVVLFEYRGEYDVTSKICVTNAEDYSEVFRGIIPRGISLSRKIDSIVKQRVLSAFVEDAKFIEDLPHQFQPHMQMFLQGELNQSIKSSSKEDYAVSANTSGARQHSWISVSPYYTDKCANLEFYSEMNVYPEYEAYATDVTMMGPTKGEVWVVRQGDPVVVHCETGAGSTSYGRNEGRHGCLKHYPFSMPWSAAEIVTIMKNAPLSSNTSNSGSDSGISLEIRWLYRARELSGSGQNLNDSRRLDCEELYESDHYDIVASETILAPIQLIPEIQPSEALSHLGMPVVQFCCKRFWSIHRKSLIPTLGLDGRVERGRSQSRFLQPNSNARNALDKRTTNISRDVNSVEYSTKPVWKHAFRQCIKKLTLTDASKDGFNACRLVGRQKEQSQLKLFLRGFICGKLPEGSKPCLFVAGPPGGGKTASVRAAISELSKETTTGKVPNFHFIALNGMEMRHPFEAYVRLWEALSGDRSKSSPEEAARQLDNFFSNSYDSSEDKQTVVVLLDEIDYLVTPKQTVLYNFFDWPSTSIERGSSRRLVVIGVSNTLNLRDRLLPRVRSRIGTNNIFYNAYNVDQIVSILTAKMLEASPSYAVFQEDAILYAAKKTSQVSGDIRKAFHICKVAAEMVLENFEKKDDLANGPVVRVVDVLASTKESSNSADSKLTAKCTPFEALLLVSVAALRKSTGRETGGFDVTDVFTKMDSVARAFGNKQYLPSPGLRETLRLLARLGEAGVLTMEAPRSTDTSYVASSAGNGVAWPMVSTKLDDTTILLALKGTPHFDLAKKYLATGNIF